MSDIPTPDEWSWFLEPDHTGDPAVRANPHLCNYRWSATRLHLCDELTGHEPGDDGILRHRCRCGEHTDEPVDQLLAKADRLIHHGDRVLEAVDRTDAAIVETLHQLDGALVAAGGLCAPVTSFYDLVDRTPWTHADLPWPRRINVDAWLFPRLWRWQLRWADARRRVGRAVAALRTPQAVEIDPEDEWW